MTRANGCRRGAMAGRTPSPAELHTSAARTLRRSVRARTGGASSERCRDSRTMAGKPPGTATTLRQANVQAGFGAVPPVLGGPARRVGGVCRRAATRDRRLGATPWPSPRPGRCCCPPPLAWLRNTAILRGASTPRSVAARPSLGDSVASTLPLGRRALGGNGQTAANPPRARPAPSSGSADRTPKLVNVIVGSPVGGLVEHGAPSRTYDREGDGSDGP
jgi:hypothetical protein